MKEKIEEIIRELQFTKYIVPTDRIRSWEDLQERPIKQLEPNWDLAVKELSTLIQEERKEAVEDFVDNIGWKKPSEVIDLADDVIDGRSLVKQMEAYLQSLDKGDTDEK